MWVSGAELSPLDEQHVLLTTVEPSLALGLTFCLVL